MHGSRKRTLRAALGALAVITAVVVVPAASATLLTDHGSMEGDMKALPGTVINGGFHFKMPGNHAAGHVTFSSALISIRIAAAAARCWAIS